MTLQMSDATKAPSAEEIIRQLDLMPHPEGGHFREMFRDDVCVNVRAPPAGRARDKSGGPEDVQKCDESDSKAGRAASTAIYFLLTRGERSHWHRVDAAEVWH